VDETKERLIYIFVVHEYDQVFSLLLVLFNYLLGIMFILLYLAEDLNDKIRKVVSVYGKAPLFYYLLHWYAAQIVMYLLLFVQGFGFADFLFGFNLWRPKAENGVSLPGKYIVWILIVLALYPICKWYGCL
jgi:cellulose synthase/poly-beta-1,6-N-acetylglucosamine synthase-like glycosyltransferase